MGTPISRTEGTVIAGAAGWTWIPFDDAFCTDAVEQPSGAYQFGESTTGLAISWGSTASTDLVVFLQGGGACWDFFTCGGAPELVPKTASTGPFGPAEFARDIHDKYPRSWVRRENLPDTLRDATVVFVPYCTGDVHSGDAVTTYAPPLPGREPVTWHHVGRERARVPEAARATFRIREARGLRLLGGRLRLAGELSGVPAVLAGREGLPRR
jgi:hypothetical protein